MSRPVIFFAFDGVLNSRRWFDANPCDGSSCDDAHVDPATVAQLNRIVEATGADVVRTNHWKLRCRHERDGYPARFQSVLGRRGFTGRVRGYTGGGATLAEEIAFWLRLQGAEQRDAFCILEAEAQLPGFGRHLVRTSRLDGLTSERADRAIVILGGSR
ncbi:HAD domain-containing protein [Sorangium sp. So ce388]|uniref:HAD domain-containing protein n=1 Tax=Sorangium sp. So ce388 TaxID=3133309 RepID=UPI003F5BCFCC